MTLKLKDYLAMTPAQKAALAVIAARPAPAKATRKSPPRKQGVQRGFDEELAPDILLWPYAMPAEDVVVHFTYTATPLAKQRPRFSPNGGKVYTPKETRHYEKELGKRFAEQMRGMPADADGRFALRCLFYRPNRQRIDCDNLLKAVSDAATGIVWHDDSQVMEVIGRLFVACSTPRIEVLISRIPDLSPRRPCLECGKPVVTYPSQGIVHCSSKCANAKHRVEVPCQNCGAMSLHPKHKVGRERAFCRPECGVEFHQKRAACRAGAASLVCPDCGGKRSRHGAKRCAGCAMKARWAKKRSGD